MERTAAPGKRLEVEEMRDRDRLHIRSQLGLALEQDVVVPKRVVLHVIVGMRRQRRAVRIHRLGVMRPRAVIALAAGDVVTIKVLQIGELSNPCTIV